MYCLVLRQLSPIQKGVQSVHACLEYVNKYGKTQEYQDYFNNDKTLIMLDGGTAPELEEIMLFLENSDINAEYFTEPDLNNCITAICFLANERVWNKLSYPNVEVFYSQNDGFTLEEHRNNWIKHVMNNDMKSVALRDLISYKKLSC